MLDRKDDAGGGFSNVVRIGLLLGGLVMMALWLTTCSGNNQAALDEAKIDAEKQQEALLSAADGEKTAAIQTLTSDFKGKMGGLQGQVTTLESTVSTLQTEKTRLESEVVDLTASLDESQAQITVGSTRGAQINAEHETVVSSLKTEIDGLKGQVTTLNGDIESLSAQLTSQEKISEIETQNLQLNGQVVELNGTIDSLKTEKVDLQSSISNKLAALGLLQTKFDDSQGTAAEDAAKVKQQVITYSKRIDTMNTELLTLRDSNTLLQSELDNVGKANSSNQAAMNTLLADSSSITKRAGKLQEHVGALSTENTGLKEQLTHSRNSLSEVQTTLETTNGELSTVRAKLETTTGELAHSRTQFDELNVELGVKTDALAISNNALNDTQGLLKQKTEVIALAATQFDELNAELGVKTDALAISNNALNDTQGLLKQKTEAIALAATQFDELNVELGVQTDALAVSTSALNDTQGLLRQKTDANTLAATASAGAASAELVQSNEALLQANTQLDEKTSLLAEANGEVERMTTAMGEQTGKLESLKEQLGQKANELAEFTSKLSKSNVKDEELIVVKTELERVSTELLDVNTQLSDSKAQLIQNASELENAQVAFESAQSEIGAKDLQLGTLSTELAALPKPGEQTEQALNLKTDLVQKLKDSGVLGATVDVRNDSDVGILISSAELFGSGRSFISSNGVSVMTKIAEALKSYSDHDIRIEGHTDNVPVGGAIKATFPSNWELSVARAASAVRFLQEAGINADRLSASGFGEYRPVADNATAEGRNQNRRIEIMMVPRNL